MEINKTDSEAYFGMAQSLSKLERYPEAILYYHKAIEIDQDYALAYYHLGMALKMTNNITDSTNAFDKAYKVKEKTY